MVYQLAFVFLLPSVPFASALGLRYLYSLFLRQSLTWFAEMKLPAGASLVIGTRMAALNCLIYGVAAFLFAGAMVLGAPPEVAAAPAVLGILAAIAVTIRLVHEALDIDLLMATPIGLVSFAGGGLPLIVFFPALLAIASFS